jgi:hypothetical protein
MVMAYVAKANIATTRQFLCANSSDDFVVFREIDLRIVATYTDKTYRRL